MKTKLSLIKILGKVSGCLLLLLATGCATTPSRQSSGSGHSTLKYGAMKIEDLEALSLHHAQSRFESIQVLIKRSMAEGDCSRGRRYAFESVQLAKHVFTEDAASSTALYDGYLALGYCDLKDGRVASAEMNLNAAANVPLTPHLETSGLAARDLTLARELLIVGQKKTVLQFVNKIRNTWKSKEAQELVTQWAQEIEKDEIPDFTPVTRKSDSEGDEEDEKQQVAAK